MQGRQGEAGCRARAQRAGQGCKGFSRAALFEKKGEGRARAERLGAGQHRARAKARAKGRAGCRAGRAQAGCRGRAQRAGQGCKIPF